MSKESRKKKQSTLETTGEVKTNSSSSSLSPSSSLSTIKTTCNSFEASNTQTFVVPSEPPQITRMKYEDAKYDLQEIHNRREFARAKVINLDREIDAYARSLSNNPIVGRSNHLFLSSAQQKSSSSSSSSATVSPEENQVSNQEKEGQQSSEPKKNKKRKLTLVAGTCKDSVMERSKLADGSDEDHNDNDGFALGPSM